jgi:formylglycine-generating enzyme required for sulfatase activity
MGDPIPVIRSASSLVLLLGCVPPATVVMDDPSEQSTAAVQAPDPEPEAPERPSAGTVHETVLVPGGIAYDDQGKQQQLADFELDRIEVTVAQYTRCVEVGACKARTTQTYIRDQEFDGACNYGVEGKADHPINCVDVEDAASYCAWVGKRLPTPVEWRWAFARDGRDHPWGNERPGGRACWQRGHQLVARPGTCVAGSHPLDVSADGALDMAANVGEWARDRQLTYVLGGNWELNFPHSLSSTEDLDYTSGFWRLETIGFRCAKERE